MLAPMLRPPLLPLLALSLSGCQLLPAAAQSPVRIGQVCGDIVEFSPLGNLGHCDLVEARVTLARSANPKTVSGGLFNLKTGAGIALHLGHADAHSGEVSLSPVRGQDWQKIFAYDTDYELRVTALDGQGRKLERRVRLHTEKAPYELAWVKTALPKPGDRVVTATITNRTPEAIQAGAVRLDVVCDQLHGTERRTVYFGSDTQSFAANETRQVRLPLLTQRDFQPQPWADVPFTECRNEYVEGLRGRRVIPTRTP